VELSNVLGKGEFGVVLEVAALHVSEECPCSNCKSNRNSANKNKQQQQQQPSQRRQRSRQKSSSSSNSATLLFTNMVEVVVMDHPEEDENRLPGPVHPTPPTPTQLAGLRRYNSRSSFAEDVKLPETDNDDNDNDNTDDDDDDSSTLSTESDEDDLSNDDTDGEVAFLRGYMSTHVVRHGRPRYAVKRLRDDLTLLGEDDQQQRMDAAVDLGVEAKFLASIRHPNIVKMRGTVGQPGSQDFMIVMDCLVMTLREKMEQWDDEQKVSSSKTGFRLSRILRNHQRQDALLKDQYADKLLAVYDIARAMRYLHNHL
jgi:hypothetical protein